LRVLGLWKVTDVRTLMAFLFPVRFWALAAATALAFAFSLALAAPPAQHAISHKSRTATSGARQPLKLNKP